MKLLLSGLVDWNFPYRYYQFCHLLQWPIKELDIKDVLGNRTP